MDYELEDVRPGGRPKKTWTEVEPNDCQIQQLHKEDAMNRSKVHYRWSCSHFAKRHLNHIHL